MMHEIDIIKINPNGFPGGGMKKCREIRDV